MKAAEVVRRPRVLGGIAAALVVAVLVGSWLHHRATHVLVTDSRIAAHVIAVSSEVAGRVTEVAVVVGDHVHEGDLLAALDTRQSQLELEEIDAQLARIDAEQSGLRAEQHMVRRQVESQLGAARSRLATAEANRRASAAELQNARSHYARLDTLYETGAVSAQSLDEFEARFLAAQQAELGATAAVETARADLAAAAAAQERVDVLEKQIATLQAGKAALQARRGQQLVDIERREVHARFDGVVDQTFVEAGEYVAPGSRLLMYHDPAEVWIDANVKETDFSRLKLGAPATISVDAYPDREFRGEVVRLGSAATSQFALLPNPNPSGNFTKVTQRLPIRIAARQQEELLRPGMMVEVSIDVVD